jgi:large repetitive protein
MNLRLPTYNLNLEVSPADAGTVTGAGQYEAGEQVNITAEANPGWEFVNWTDDDGIVSEAANFTYTMPAEDVTLTANFVEEQVGFNCGDPLLTPAMANPTPP